MLFVERSCPAVADAALQPDEHMALLFQDVFGCLKERRSDALPVPCRQDEYLSYAVTFPAGESDNFPIDNRDGHAVDARADARLEESERAAHGDLRIEMRVTRMPGIVPNASERRNVSGARPSDRYVGGCAQRPSTAFAMMLRWTSFDPA